MFPDPAEFGARTTVCCFSFRKAATAAAAFRLKFHLDVNVELINMTRTAVAQSAGI